MSTHLEHSLQRNSVRALAMGLGLVALAGLVVAFFAHTDSTFFLRVMGFVAFGVAGMASLLTFVRSRRIPDADRGESA